jgi:hypothetical protein
MRRLVKTIIEVITQLPVNTLVRLVRITVSTRLSREAVTTTVRMPVIDVGTPSLMIEPITTTMETNVHSL